MKHRWWILIVLLMAMVYIVGPALPAYATTLPSDFSEVTVVSGLSSPTAFAMAPDGRIFVLEQDGAVRVIKNGALLPTPFTTISVNSTGERGLLGIAFDPNFTSNRYIYLYHTTNTGTIHNRVIRVTADASNPDVMESGSRITLLDLNNLSATNHNGGAMHFGSDGMLYIAVGENAVQSNSQTLSNLLGKVLRMDVVADADDGLANADIPTDNPFFATATGNNRLIWTMGLRNPYTFSVQPGTGRIFINDVGQGTWEEINDGVSGRNYGWPDTEGEFDTGDFPDYTLPLYTYDHGGNDPDGCAITGGAFYNPDAETFPAEYVGDYFFADFCGNWIYRYNVGPDTVAQFATSTVPDPVDLLVAPDGSLYYLARGDGNGQVLRISYTATPLPPNIITHPQDTTVTDGGDATFTCAASGSGTITYQWQRDDVDIPDATGTSYTLEDVALSDDGAVFTCIATNMFGSTPSNDATLTVVPNQPPLVNITLPVIGAHYKAGNTIKYSATATDPEDGALPGSAFTWQVDFHHADHEHPHMPAKTGSKSGKFTIPTTGETATDVFYRITLTVTDSEGMETVVTRDVLPLISTITIASNPSGMGITVDGVPATTPASFDSVVGMNRTIGALSPESNGGIWVFKKWSDGGAQVHTITTPTNDTTYTATYELTELRNPSFEDDTDNNNVPDKWKFTNRASSEGQDCSIAVDGACSLMLVGNGTKTSVKQDISLKGRTGDAYTLDFSTRADSTGEGQVTVELKLTFTDGTSNTIMYSFAAGTFDWTAQQLNLTATKAYKKLTITITSSAGASGSAWVDAVALSLD
jgi:glucose/arabinose dehydrogenase